MNKQTVTFDGRLLPSSVTVVGTTYHRMNGGEAQSHVTRFHVKLSSDEQPFVRTLDVKEEWTPLDHGWIERASVMELENTSKTADLEVATRGMEPFTVVPPGQSIRLCKPSLKWLDLRMAGGGRPLLYLFPE